MIRRCWPELGNRKYLVINLTDRYLRPKSFSKERNEVLMYIFSEIKGQFTIWIIISEIYL